MFKITRQMDGITIKGNKASMRCEQKKEVKPILITKTIINTLFYMFHIRAFMD